MCVPSLPSAIIPRFSYFFLSQGFSAFFHAALFFREENKWFTRSTLHSDFGGKVGDFCQLNIAQVYDVQGGGG